MNVLGILYLNQDPAASLMVDGRIVAMAEEERFNRNKHARGCFPAEAVKYCLASGNLRLSDIQHLAVGWDISAYKRIMPRLFGKLDRVYPDKDGLTRKWEEKQMRLYGGNNYPESIVSKLVECGYDKTEIPPISFVRHHYAHALSAFVHSGFHESIVLVIDGHGEEHCTTIWTANEKGLRRMKAIDIPHSLGWFYSAVTTLCGFLPNDGEGKTMGLAPYGSDNLVLRENISRILACRNGGYSINPSNLYYGRRTKTHLYNDSFFELLGKPEVETGTPGKLLRDIAFEAQRALEKAVLNLCEWSVRKTHITNVCLAGGVALNCKMNGEILRSPLVRKLFIQPVSSDVGTTFGASFAIYKRENRPLEHGELRHIYLGPRFSEGEILSALKKRPHRYRKIRDIERKTAGLLAQGLTVGWFQGRMEVGPRALGNRSILADPRRPGMKDVVNNKVKFREPWRPFCPSVLYEHQHKYFIDSVFHPFMILAVKVRPEKESEIPAVVHVDHTARIQSVTFDENPRYWNLINEFYKITHVPVLLNTSMNLRGEPICCTPLDALNLFCKSSLDCLVLDDYLVEKAL
jgi:carbamoyltransferase